MRPLRPFISLLMLLMFLLLACQTDTAVSTAVIQVEEVETVAPEATFFPTLEPTYAAQIAAMRSPDVPDLPFADNPDPTQCGIPTPWGPNGRAYLSGMYQGELIQPTVFLYDSHSRFEITGRAEHGTAVDIILYQQNPTLDYYFVKVINSDTKIEGWVPAPFLSFEPLQS